MAWLQIDVFSKNLIRSVPLQAVLPAERRDGPFRTLYLLCGMLGDNAEWLLHADLEELSIRHNLCIVTVSGENAFYTDHPLSGTRWCDFVGRELVELTRELLPLSHERGDTVIAGESMGGFGALRAGMLHPETFGHVISLSPALVLGLAKRSTDGEGNVFDLRRSYYNAVFGDADRAVETDLNPVICAAKAEKKTDVFLSCGRDDVLFPAFEKLCGGMAEAGYPITRDDAEGGHEWGFWTKALERGLVHALGAPYVRPADYLKSEVEKQWR